MILVDTSIWVDHIRHTDTGLQVLLKKGLVLCHPFVIGELAVGNLPRRRATLSELGNIPQATMASDAEVLETIEARKLYAKGSGYIDIHLLLSTRLTPGTLLWTRDKNLLGLAQQFSIRFARP